MDREFEKLKKADGIIDISRPLARSQMFNCAPVTEYVEGKSLKRDIKAKMPSMIGSHQWQVCCEGLIAIRRRNIGKTRSSPIFTRSWTRRRSMDMPASSTTAF
jgi:hypothetical protein